jgi:hypothetical protein
MFFGNKHTAWWKAGAVSVLLILLVLTVVLGERFTPFGSGGDQAPSIEAGQTANAGDGTGLNGAEATDPAKQQVSKEPEITPEQYDVALIGSEVEGLYLARSAADLGLKVIVLDPREKAGGQLLLGEMLFLDETRDDDYRTLVQGEAKKLFDGFRNGTIRKLPEFQKVYDGLMKDIPLESGIQIAGIQKEDGKQAVKSIDIVTKEGVSRRIKASYWVENSDYAALVSQLDGVTRLPGLEKFYGQSEIEYMSSGMMLKFKNVDWKKFTTHFHSISAEERSKLYGYGVVNESFIIGLTGVTNKYKATNDRVFLRGLNAVYQRDGDVIINAFLIYTVDPSKPESIAEALELGRKETPLIRDHFRKHIVGWENAEVNGYPEYLYIREYNHYETEYVLQVSDMLAGNMFADNVSIAGYPLDLQGTSANKWGIEMGRPDKYGMPLRSFLLKNYENVIMAGKNVGASAIAYGSARIQPNTMAAAESIGVILGQIHGKKKLRDVTDEDMKEFHKLLEEKYRIKLTGMKANNKIAGWTDEEIRKLNSGEITYPAYIKTRKAK